MKGLNLLLLVILLAILPNASAYTFNINQSSHPQFVLYDNTNTWFNQSFTTDNTANTSQYEVNSVDLYGANVAGSTQITVTITNNTYTSQPVTGTIVSPAGWNTITFPQGSAILYKNSQYYINVTHPVGASFLAYLDLNGNPYAGGRAFDASGSYNANSDMAFNISMTSHDNVGSWTFNQGTGAYANDSSGNNLNLTLRNTTWGISTNNGSVNSSSVSFNGQYSNATNGNGPLLNVSDITMSFWIKTSNSSGGFIFQRYVLSGGFQGYGLMLSRTTPGKFDFYSDTGNWKNNLNPTSIIDSKWHYVAVTGENSTNSGKMYIDGSQVGTFVYSKPTDFNATLMIGSDIQGIDSINATLDEISLYNYAFNASEVSTEFQRFHATPAYPVANLNITSSSATTFVNFSWYDTVYSSDELTIATDSAFTSIVHDAFYTNDFANISLTSNTTYYWKVRQFNSGTGSYGNTSETQKFTLSKFNGYLNIVVLDELTFKIVPIYNATLYNGIVKSKSTSTGVVNFTSSDVGPGQFELVINVNSTYGERAIIVNSPGNYTVFVPNAVVNTVDFVSFYLLDYTGRFPFSVSNLTITKGVNTTHSQYFDSDAKVAANLIRGEVYTITVFNPLTDSMQQWGSYSSTGTGGVQVVIIDLGVNQSILQPYVQRINASNASIDVSWNDLSNVLQWVNISVFKDNTSTLVYNLNTTIGTGTASYPITDLNATYITVVNASTSIGFKQDTSIFSAISQSTGLIKTWSYGSMTIPSWVKNAFAIIVMFMLAGSFGAMHRGEGAIITAFMGVFLWWYDILSLQGAAGALFGGFVLYSVLYHLESKRRQGIL